MSEENENHEEINKLNGDKNIYFSELKPNSINFCLTGDETSGRLFIENGLLCFDGDLHESAEVLFKYVCDAFNKD